MTILQKMCSALQYTNFLDEASNSNESMHYISAFAFSRTIGTLKFRKPFGSLIGETFDYVDPERKFRFFAEQISEDLSACHCENENFIYTQDLKLKLSYKGKNLEISPEGNQKIILKQKGEIFSIKNFGFSVENLIVGEIYLELTGEMQILNENNKEKTVIYAVKRNWNEKEPKELMGKIFDCNGELKEFIQIKIDYFFKIFDLEKKEKFNWKIFENNDKIRRKTEELSKIFPFKILIFLRY